MSFARHVFTISTANAAAQAVAFLAFPLITRLYSPDEFGAASMVLSLVLTIGPLSTLRFDAASLLPEQGRDDLGLLFLGALASLAMALLAALVLAVPGAAQGAARLLSMPENSALLWFVPPGILASGLYQCAFFMNVRAKRFGTVGAGRIADSAVDKALVLALGFALSPGGWAVALGRVVGLGAGAWAMFRTQAARLGELAARPPGPAELKTLARRHADFPKFEFGALLINNVSREFVVVCMGLVSGEAAAGFLALGLRVVRAPLALLGDAVYNVFLQRATEAVRDGQDLAGPTGRLLGALGHLALAPLFVLVLFGPDLFGLVFGEQWRQSGRFVAVMAPAFFLMTLYKPISALFVALKDLRARFAFDAGLVAARLGLLTAVGLALASAEAGVAALSLGSCLVFILALGHLVKLAGLGRGAVALRIARKAAMFLPMALALGWARLVANEHPWTALALGAAGLAAYVLAVRFFDPEARALVAGLRSRRRD